jgi:hypothetical protein
MLPYQNSASEQAKCPVFFTVFFTGGVAGNTDLGLFTGIWEVNWGGWG